VENWRSKYLTPIHAIERMLSVIVSLITCYSSSWGELDTEDGGGGR